MDGCQHEYIARNESRRAPLRCVDCGMALDVAALAALVIRWISEDRARLDALEVPKTLGSV